MSFEALSCAMAHVIINYHAQQKKSSVLLPEDSDTLEKVLNCKTKKINSTLKTKIDEATTGTSSSRRTLLEYMHFGIALARRAAQADTPETIEKYQVQLIQLLENLKSLLITTSFWPSTLNVTIIKDNQEKPLAISLFGYRETKAKTLLTNFFTAIDLSSESTHVDLQNNITQRFENHALLTQNRALKSTLEEHNKSITFLTNKLDTLTKKPSKPATELQTDTSSLDQEKKDTNDEDFEYISLHHDTEKARLLNENEKLSKAIEEKTTRIEVLTSLIKKLKETSKKTPQKQQKKSKSSTATPTSDLHQRKQTYTAQSGIFFSKTTTTTQPKTTKSSSRDESTSAKRNSRNSKDFSISSLLSSVLSAKPDYSDDDEQTLANGKKVV